MSSQIQGVYFDQYYSPVVHAYYFIINIDVADMHRLTDRILDVSYDFQNKNAPINEKLCVSRPTHYMDRFEKSYPNVPLNQYDITFPFNV